MTSKRAEQILDIAEAGMRHRGYDAVSFRDIAQSIGIKSASVHYHYPTKTALGAAVTQRYADAFLAKLGDPASQSETPHQRLDRLADAYLTSFDERSSLCLCTALGATSARLPEEVSSQIEAFFARLEDWIANALAETSDRSSAGIVLSLLQGAMVLAVVRQNDAPLLDAKTSIGRMIQNRD